MLKEGRILKMARINYPILRERWIILNEIVGNILDCGIILAINMHVGY